MRIEREAHTQLGQRAVARACGLKLRDFSPANEGQPCLLLILAPLEVMTVESSLFAADAEAGRG